MAATGKSLLLQCLSQLDDDAWVDVLMPHLLASGSVFAVAQTCTQLRDKVFRAIWDVTLSDLELIPDTSSVAEWVAPLPEHFPNCKLVNIRIAEEQDCLKVPHMLPALARLPKLSGLRLCADSQPAPTPLAMLLQSACTALAGVWDLWMQFEDSWPQTKLVWQEVAFYSHLTALQIHYRYKEDTPWADGDLAPLSRLCNLQEFTLQPFGLPAQPPLGEPQPATAEGGLLQCLGGMTSLTALKLGLQQASGLEIVSACSNLAKLEVWHAPSCRLTDAQWGAIAQLTQLTFLSFSPEEGAPSAACYDALCKLARLQALDGYGWTEEALPLLRNLTALTYIAGSWEAAPGSFVGGRVSCPNVQELARVRGPAPFAAFPNLRAVGHVGTLPLATLSELQGCQHLQELTAEYPRSAGERMDVSLPPSEPVAVRVAAVKSLGKLHKLTSITLKPSDNEEVAAFAEVVAMLRGKELRRVGVVVVHGAGVSCPGLLPFGNLSGLEEFYLDVSRVGLSWLDAPAPLLCKTKGVQRLRLMLPQVDVPVWNRVCEEVGAAGLGGPVTITVQYVVP